MEKENEITELNSTIMDKKIIRILLIQDNLADAQLIRKVLESKTSVNFELIHVREFLNALNDIDENNFDVILLDLSLPYIQGLDTLKKTLTDVPKIPVITLTGKDGEVLGLKALRLGVQDYLVKEEITSNLLVRSIFNAIERKKLEEEIKQKNITLQNKLEIEIEYSQKSDSLDAISGGVAHDLNNVFQLINLNLYLLEQKIPVGSPALEYLNKSNKVLAHASELTKKILTLSQKKTIEFKQNNLNSIISEFSKTLNRVIEENIEISYYFENTVDTIKCDSTQIERVLMNLFGNARDAMPHGGTLTLKTYNECVNENSKFPGIKSGNYICMEITDTGTGIPIEAQAKIFKPFFTTKEVGKGTGMGLSVVYEIIKIHNGFIDFSSNENGTVFKVFLPLIDVEHDETAKSNNEMIEKPSINPINNSIINILLVEDNQNIRLVTTYFLESHNFKVFSAHDGLEALEIFQKKKAEINLVFTDLVLPKKSGLEIYNEITDKYPEMRFLFTSGYNSPPQETLDFIRNKRLNFIQKPYKPDALIKNISEMFTTKI